MALSSVDVDLVGPCYGNSFILKYKHSNGGRRVTNQVSVTVAYGVSESRPWPGGSPQRFNIVNSPHGVIFIQHEVTLHLGRTDLGCGFKDVFSEVLSQRRHLPWVEPLEHLGELPV